MCSSDLTRMKRLGLESVFPIWKRETPALARSFIDRGFQARLVCVDTRVLDASFAGRLYDASLLKDLPDSVDVCGENGEFHSFVCAGPMLARPVPVAVGETVERDGFAYADLLPG
mgnify:CR=1 FL=1